MSHCHNHSVDKGLEMRKAKTRPDKQCLDSCIALVCYLSDEPRLMQSSKCMQCSNEIHYLKCINAMFDFSEADQAKGRD